MRTLLLFFCIFAPVIGRAQISVQVVLDQEVYLANEPLIVKVRIANSSGRTLTFGKDADWLTFNIDGRDNIVVAQLQPVPVQGEFKLDSSTTGIKRVNLEPCFRLTRPARYTVVATVKVPGWEESFSSKPKTFDITQGSKLWETTFGVPSADKSEAAPEIRRYILQQANRTKEMTLYLRLTDGSGTDTYKVFPLGNMVSFSRPEPQLDKASNLHLLYQNSARGFNYCVITPDGNWLKRQAYDYTDTRPILRTDDDGSLIIKGGVRRPTSTDIPKAAEFEDTTNDKTPAP